MPFESSLTLTVDRRFDIGKAKQGMKPRVGSKMRGQFEAIVAITKPVFVGSRSRTEAASSTARVSPAVPLFSYAVTASCVRPARNNSDGDQRCSLRERLSPSPSIPRIETR